MYYELHYIMLSGSKPDIRSVPHFVPDVGRVIKFLTRFYASTKWVRTFDPDII